MALKTFVFGTFKNRSKNIRGLHNGKTFDPKAECKKEGGIRMKLLGRWEEKHEDNWKMSGIIMDSSRAEGSINRDKLVMEEILNKMKIDAWKEKYGDLVEFEEKNRVRTEYEVTKADSFSAIGDMNRDNLVREVENKLRLVDWEEKYNNSMSLGMWEHKIKWEEKGEVRKTYNITNLFNRIKNNFFELGMDMDWDLAFEDIEDRMRHLEEQEKRDEEEEEDVMRELDRITKDGFSAIKDINWVEFVNGVRNKPKQGNWEEKYLRRPSAEELEEKEEMSRTEYDIEIADILSALKDSDTLVKGIEDKLKNVDIMDPRDWHNKTEDIKIQHRDLVRENYNEKPLINVNYWYEYSLMMNSSRKLLLVKFDSVDGKMLGKISSYSLHSSSIKSSLAQHSHPGCRMELAIVDIDKMDKTLQEKLKKDLQIQDLGIGLMAVKNGKVVDQLFGVEEVKDKEAIKTFIRKLIYECERESREEHYSYLKLLQSQKHEDEDAKK